MGSSTTPYLQVTWPSRILDKKSAIKTMVMLSCKLPLIVIVAPWKLISEYANRGRGIHISGHRRPPIYRSWSGHVTYFWNFGTLHISGTVGSRNVKFGKQIYHPGYKRKKCKIRSKGVWKGSRDLLMKFWDPSIYWERLELETSNFACRFITTGINERNAKLGKRGSGRGHVTYFWNFVTPSYVGNGWN